MNVFSPRPSRRSAFKLSGDQGASVDISSLIDVSFLLLIYFLVTTTLMEKEVDVGLAIPPPTGVSVSQWSPLHVAIAADGVVSVGSHENKRAIGPAMPSGKHPALIDALSDYKASADRAHGQAFVKVSAEDQASHQAFVSVMNALQLAGIEDLLIDAEQTAPRVD